MEATIPTARTRELELEPRPEPQARIPGLPVLIVLLSFPIALFVAALATDIAYAATADMLWADFAAWLLAGALAGAVVAALAGLVLVVARRGARARLRVWPLVLGGIIVLALSVFDNLVHSRDAWTSVVPSGLALSALIVAVILLTAWRAAPRARPAGVRP